MQEPLVTIGIPLYNAKDYIAASLESVLNQTYQNIEVIVVNDCSTDGCQTIVEQMARSHERGCCIRLLHHEQNGGCAMARNTIIDNAKGKYLLFHDSDDLLTPDCVEHLIGIAVQKGDDMVIGSYTERNTITGKKTAYVYDDAHREGEGCLCLYKYSEVKSQPLAVALWNTIYDMDFLRRTGVRMIPFKAGSDNIFNKGLMTEVRSFSVSSRQTYIYIVRQDSIMSFYEESIDAAKFTLRQEFRREERCYISQCAAQPYAANMARQNFSASFHAAKAMVRNRRKFTPSFPLQTFGDILSYPYTLRQTLRLKENRLLHLAFWSFCKLPARIKYWLICSR